jgi:hypothetical protein
VFRALGSTLRMKAQVDSSSRSQKDFICREEKGWSHGSDWKLSFYSLFLNCPSVAMSLRCTQKFPGKEKCFLSQLSPFRTSCSPSFNSLLSMIALTTVKDRDDEVYSVTASC